MKAAVIAVLVCLFVAQAAALDNSPDIKPDVGAEVSQLIGLDPGQIEILKSEDSGEIESESEPWDDLGVMDAKKDPASTSSDDEISILLGNALDAMEADLKAEVIAHESANNALPSQLAVDPVAGSLVEDDSATESLWLLGEPEVALAGSTVTFPRPMPLIRGGPLPMAMPQPTIPGRARPGVSLPIPLEEILSILTSISGPQDSNQVIIFSNDDAMMPGTSAPRRAGAAIGWNGPEDNEDEEETFLKESTADAAFNSLEDTLLAGIQSTLSADLLVGPGPRDLDALFAARAQDREAMRLRAQRSALMDRFLRGSQKQGMGEMAMAGDQLGKAGKGVTAREVQRETELADAEASAASMPLPLLLGGLLMADDGGSVDDDDISSEDDDDVSSDEDEAALFGGPLLGMGFGPLDCLARFMSSMADDMNGGPDLVVEEEEGLLDVGPFGPFFRPSFRSGGPLSPFMGGPFPQLRPRPQFRQLVLTPFGPVDITAGGSMGGPFDDDDDEEEEEDGREGGMFGVGRWTSVPLNRGMPYDRALPLHRAMPFFGPGGQGVDAGPARVAPEWARRPPFEGPRRMWGPRWPEGRGDSTDGEGRGDVRLQQPGMVGMMRGLWARDDQQEAGTHRVPLPRRGVPGNLRPHPPSALHHAFNCHPLAFLGLLLLATALVAAVVKLVNYQHKSNICQGVVSVSSGGMQAPLLTTTRVVAVSLPYAPVHSPTEEDATTTYVPPSVMA
eukprot:jgi/Mesvir1/19676/Mv09948-RA.1